MTVDAILLTALTVLPFLGSMLSSGLHTRARTSAAALAGLVSVAGLGMVIALYPRVAGGQVFKHEITWLPSLGLNLSLRLDGVSWVFALLITGIGALVVLYARYYMSPDDPVPRFFGLLQAFMGAMLLLVASGNLIQLVFAWELTSLFSFLLIGYWYHNANARDGARLALLVTSLGGFCLLLGVIVLGSIAGSYDVDAVLAAGPVIRAHQYFVPALVLILVGTFSKSAQFPFHFWLPHAMAAPTPVSAYLHSATMVKAGVFLMTLLWPVFSPSDVWYYGVGTAGLVTFLLGGFVAIFQNDLKGILAYSTISHLGLITLLLGLGTPTALVAAVFHVLNHATFKAGLFMAAGIIDHETGTRDVRKLSGLFRALPFTGSLAMIATAAMAGVPLVNGFLSKEMFLAEAIDVAGTGGALDRFLPVLATLGSAFGVIYSVRFIHQVFFGPAAKDLPKKPHEPVAWMRLPIELLVLVVLAVGILPARVIGPVLQSAVRSVLGDATPYYSLALWHGFTPALRLSLIAMGAGALVYTLFRRYLARIPDEGPAWAGVLRARRVFDLSLYALVRGAQLVLRFLGTAKLQPQMLLLTLVALGAGLWPFALEAARGAGWYLPIGPVSSDMLEPSYVTVWVFGSVFAVLTAYLAKFHRFAALITLAGTGLTMVLAFVWLSAPDLALTQLVVEVVTTVLLLLGLRWLPRPMPAEERSPREVVRARARRVRDLIVAVAAGAGVAMLAYAGMTMDPANRLREGSLRRFFVENAYEGAGGHNVVNVVLVDFRAFDTMGEITVLGIVALTVFALLRRFRPPRELLGGTRQQQRQAAYDAAAVDREVGDTATDFLYVARTAMHLMFPVLGVFAVYLFMRGHDEPGGGFAAGVTMAIAFILQYMARGARWVEERLRVLPVRWIGAGLLIAVLTGTGAWLFGEPLLKSYYEHFDLPVIGDVPVASAMLFDLGVLILVVGATVLMLVALAHQSIRAPRTSSREGEGATREEVEAE
jgi:multicomponent K+:H+ antiporter subunit A